MKTTRDKISKIITSIFIMLVLSIFIIVTIATISIRNKSTALASSLDNLHEQTQAMLERQKAHNNDTSITPQEAIHLRFLSIRDNNSIADHTQKEKALTDRISTITDECIELETDLDLMIQQLEINDRQSIMRFHINELEILFRIVEAEATGEDITGKELVALVILNRVNNFDFPNTITEVVFEQIPNSQYHHFSPLDDNRYYTVTITDNTRQAVFNVLTNQSEYNTGNFNATFFQATYLDKTGNWQYDNLDLVLTHGCHSFYVD